MICPLIDQEIDTIDCLENTDIIDSFISDDSHIPKKFKAKSNYVDICKNCKYHNSTWDINANTAE